MCIGDVIEFLWGGEIVTGVVIGQKGDDICLGLISPHHGFGWCIETYLALHSPIEREYITKLIAHYNINYGYWFSGRTISPPTITQSKKLPSILFQIQDELV